MEVRADWNFDAGVDWGHQNPAVLLPFASDSSDRVVCMDEFYKTRVKIHELIDAAKRLTDVYSIRTWYCDPSRPDMVQEFQSNGMDAVGVRVRVNTKESIILEGLEMIRKFLEDNRLFFSSKCLNTIQEFQQHHYPDQEQTKSERIREQPVDSENHAIAATRYYLTGKFGRMTGMWTGFIDAEDGQENQTPHITTMSQ